jgi:hypothetical protein
MESKNQNILLIALAGFGLYYFFKKKNVTTPVVPPTTGGGSEFIPIEPTPPRKIITPVEPSIPIYETPISVLPKLTDPISDIISVTPVKQTPVAPKPVTPTPVIPSPVKTTPIFDLPIIDNPIPTPPRQIITPVEPSLPAYWDTIDTKKPIVIESPKYDRFNPPVDIYTPKYVVEPTPSPDKKIITPVEPIVEIPVLSTNPPASIWDAPIIDNPIIDRPIYKDPNPIYRQPSPIIDFPIFQPEPSPIYQDVFEKTIIPDAPIVKDDFFDTGYVPIENAPGGSGSGSYYIPELIGGGSGGLNTFLQNQVWLGNLNSFQAQSYESFDTIKADTSEFA